MDESKGEILEPADKKQPKQQRTITEVRFLTNLSTGFNTHTALVSEHVVELGTSYAVCRKMSRLIRSIYEIHQCYRIYK